MRARPPFLLDRLVRRVGSRVLESSLVFALVLGGWVTAEQRGWVASPDAREGPEGLDELDQLRARGLLMPVEGADATRLTDHFADPRGNRRHEAIDIMAPRGTPVRAVDDGVIAKLYRSGRGGLTIYQCDPEQRFAYYYAHLDRFAADLREGDRVRRGQMIGAVGSTGNASPDAPHLHFAIYRLGPERRWWQGQPINPYPVLRKEE